MNKRFEIQTLLYWKLINIPFKKKKKKISILGMMIKNSFHETDAREWNSFVFIKNYI